MEDLVAMAQASPGGGSAKRLSILIPVANYLVFRSWVFAQRVETAAKEPK